MAKTRLFNRPNRSEGLGVGAVEAGGEEEEKGTGRDGGEGKERAAHETPYPPQSHQQAESGPTGQKRGTSGWRQRGGRGTYRGALGGRIRGRKGRRDPTGPPG